MINWLGDRFVLVGAGAWTLALYWGIERRGWAVAGFLAGAPLFEGLVSHIVARSRPEGFGFGYPSGHVFGSVVVYGLLAVILCRHGRWGFVRWTVALLAAALILGMGVARLGLRAHWPTDVLGGWLGGLAYLSLGVWGLGLAQSPSLHRYR
jgi:undecaprenyl-diphosphatase